MVLHERQIRKAVDSFASLRTSPNRREKFLRSLNGLIEEAPITICASIIDKKRYQAQHAYPRNPYEVALHFCMEQLWLKLDAEKQQGKRVHVVFESRGGKEDMQLELQFRRITTNQSLWASRQFDFRRFEFDPVFASKKANSSGLQLADLTARPIALSYLCPKQRNRAFEIIKPKLEGVKHFP